MDLLFEIYGFSYPMNWARNSTRFVRAEAESGGWMFGIAVMATVCAAGMAFYVRFLVALCTECVHRRICYLVRLEPRANQYSTLEPLEMDKSLGRAA
jgi:hypothetical protein